MVAISDLARVNELYRQGNAIDRGIANFEGTIPEPPNPPPDGEHPVDTRNVVPGRILAMLVSDPLILEPGETDDGTRWNSSGVEVPTAYMRYPQQMVNTIVQTLRQRRAEIDSELAALGVTGLNGRAAAR